MKFLVKNELVNSTNEITPRYCEKYDSCNCDGGSAQFHQPCATNCKNFCAGKFCHGAGSRVEWM